jgi:hypothetical protein
MLVPLPEILIGMVENESGRWVLKEDATPEQKEAFKKFVKKTERETIIEVND